MQREVAYTDPARAAGVLARAQAEAMKAAASNTSAGPAMAFMGMGMAGQAGGMNAQALYQMAQENRQAQMAGGQFANAGQPGFMAGAGQMPAGGNAGQRRPGIWRSCGYMELFLRSDRKCWKILPFLWSAAPGSCRCRLGVQLWCRQ